VPEGWLTASDLGAVMKNTPERTSEGEMLPFMQSCLRILCNGSFTENGNRLAVNEVGSSFGKLIISYPRW